MRKLLYVIFPILFLISTINVSSTTLIEPVKTSKANPEPDPIAVKEAINAFKGLSKKEKRAKIKEVKKEIKAYKAAKKTNNEPSTNTLLLVILAILLPPLAVYLHQGEINSKFWISLLLTLLFWLPGVIYALIVILGDE